MNDFSVTQDIFAHYAAALSYPGPGFAHSLEGLAALLAPAYTGPARKVEEFIHLMGGGRGGDFDEHYTRAFDLSPIAVPYLSVYLFGAENPQRGQFMAGLMAAYAKAGFECHRELPDHLAVVLRYAAVAPREEAEELVRLCLPAPVRHMCRGLQEGGNPYHLLLVSLEDCLQLIRVGELSHA